MYSKYYCDVKKEHTRRAYHEKKEKTKLHEEWYKEHGGEQTYYRNYYKRFQGSDTSGIDISLVIVASADSISSFNFC